MSSSSYEEYPIRCMTCFAFIADKAKAYGMLLQQLKGNQEEALNKMRITQPCCRKSFLQPHMIYFNMERNRVVDGIVSPEDYVSSDDDEIEGESLEILSEDEKSVISDPLFLGIPSSNNVSIKSVDVGANKKVMQIMNKYLCE